MWKKVASHKTIFRSIPRLLIFRSINEQASFELSDLIITKSCARRIAELNAHASTEFIPSKYLRLSVEGGGCSVFQYNFELDESEIGPDDMIFERDGSRVVTDESSMEFVRGSTIDFTQEMIRSSFAVVNNPNSESACGCGSSFALKAFSDNPAFDWLIKLGAIGTKSIGAQ